MVLVLDLPISLSPLVVFSRFCCCWFILSPIFRRIYITFPCSYSFTLAWGECGSPGFLRYRSSCSQWEGGGRGVVGGVGIGLVGMGDEKAHKHTFLLNIIDLSCTVSSMFSTEIDERVES